MTLTEKLATFGFFPATINTRYGTVAGYVRRDNHETPAQCAEIEETIYRSTEDSSAPLLDVDACRVETREIATHYTQSGELATLGAIVAALEDDRDEYFLLELRLCNGYGKDPAHYPCSTFYATDARTANGYTIKAEYDPHNLPDGGPRAINRALAHAEQYAADADDHSYELGYDDQGNHTYAAGPSGEIRQGYAFTVTLTRPECDVCGSPLDDDTECHECNGCDGCARSYGPRYNGQCRCDRA